MPAIRFVMIGGFLGAGKTTTIARLAGLYTQRGLNVGIVTNDQAEDLVDTLMLRNLGFQVGEVAGACFCCNFDELTQTVARLGVQQQPDVVIAEPVGSCTDLAATVIQPLLHLHNERFEIAPFGVILKPSHGLRILGGRKNAGFSPKAEYIFRKQLEEADFVVINRIDELSAENIHHLTGLVEQEYPGVTILKMSARDGVGFEGLVQVLEQKGNFGGKILELDYDTYAAGEAELGWLNCSFVATSGNKFELDDVLVQLIEQTKTNLAEIEAETAHLKTIGLWEGFHGVANLVSSDSAVDLSLPSDCMTNKAEIVLNARVAVAPEVLQAVVRRAIAAVADKFSFSIQIRRTQCFRPGRPEPTHRVSKGNEYR